MKTNNIFMIFAILMATIFSACSEHMAEEIGEATATPKYWEPTSDFYTSAEGVFVNVDIIFNDINVTKPARHTVSLLTEDTITAVGDYPFFCKEDLAEGKEAEVSMQYSYCYNKTNTIKVNGLVMSYEYNGKTYSLPCASTITVVGSMTEAEEVEAGLANSTVYTAVANGKKLAKGVQEFLAVKPDAPVVDPAEPIKWYPISNTKAVVVFDNDSTAEVAHNMGITAEELIKREGTTALSYNSLSAKAASSINFSYNHNINNVVKVNGLNFVYKYNGKEYKNLPCAVEMTVKGNHSVTTNKKDGYEFYELSKTVYSLFAGETAIAEATQNFEISKARTKTDVSRSYEHDTFQKNGILSGSTISILCDNIAKFIQKYSDGSQDEAVAVNYTVTNTFGLSMPKFKVNATTDIVGVKADLVNGRATVLGQNISVNFKSADVSAIMFDNKDYRKEAPKCKVYAKSIEFVTIDKAVITFAEENGNTVATVEVPVSVVVISIIPGDVVELFATDHYNGRTLKGTAIHARRADGTVYSFEIGSDVNGGTVTTTSVTGTYAWIWNTKSWELGLVEASKGDNSDVSEYIIKYYTLKGQLANALGYAEATLNGKGFRNPVHTVTYDEATGVWTITVEGKSYFYASQN